MLQYSNVDIRQYIWPVAVNVTHLQVQLVHGSLTFERGNSRFLLATDGTKSVGADWDAVEDSEHCQLGGPAE